MKVTWIKYIYERKLISRTKKFAIRIIRLVKSLPEKDKVSDVIGRQILRSGTAIGANYRSALRGRSDKDFLSRITIAEEEADETILAWVIDRSRYCYRKKT